MIFEMQLVKKRQSGKNAAVITTVRWMWKCWKKGKSYGELADTYVIFHL